MKNKTYFVSAWLQNESGDTYATNLSVEIDFPITSMETIRIMESEIKKSKGVAKVTIIFYKEFED